MILCFQCGKETINKKFCSVNCKGKFQEGRPFSEDHKRKISESLKGENHPLFGKPEKSYWYNKNLPESMKKKIGENQKGKKHWLYGKKRPEKVKKKISKSMIRRYQENPILKENIRKRMINGGAAKANSFIKNPSKPQVELFNMVRKLYISAVINYPFFRYNLDIVIPEYRIAIEYDGSYWHQDKEYDKRRQTYLERHGWKILRYVDYIPTNEKLTSDIRNLALEMKYAI